MFLYNPWKFHLLFYIILLKLPHTASSIPLFFFLELLIPVKIQTEKGHLRTYFFWKSSPGFLDLSLYLWKFQIKWANWAIPEKIQTGKKKKNHCLPLEISTKLHPWKFHNNVLQSINEKLFVTLTVSYTDFGPLRGRGRV